MTAERATAPADSAAPARAGPRHPLLYQLNTRVRLTELSRALGRPATLDDLGDAELDRWAALGFMTDKQKMDLVMTVGQYTQVSMMPNSFGVQLDPGQERARRELRGVGQDRERDAQEAVRAHLEQDARK